MYLLKKEKKSGRKNQKVEKAENRKKKKKGWVSKNDHHEKMTVKVCCLTEECIQFN